MLSLPFLTGVLISDVIKNIKLPPVYWIVDPRQLSQHCDSSPCCGLVFKGLERMDYLLVGTCIACGGAVIFALVS